MRIDFYFNVEDRMQYACRLVRKARAADKTVLVFATDAARLARFDAALWIFSALDFVPHVYADSPLAARTPVLLTLDAHAPAPACDLLLNLDDGVPPDLAALSQRHERILEVVSRDEADRAGARARFRAYRDAGLAPNHIDTTQAAA
jgi:DNA polymerase-3 subunit chi